MITDTTATRTSKPPGETQSASEDAAESFDRVFAESGMNRASVLTAFSEIVESLPKNDGRERQLRDIAKSAVLSTARFYGNIIETGRVLLGCIDELGDRHNLNVRECKDHLLLGLAEGACQIGPIVYGRFLDVASDYRDNADDWIAKNRKQTVVLADISLPVIVPFEAELTLSSRSFKDSHSTAAGSGAWTQSAPKVEPTPEGEPTLFNEPVQSSEPVMITETVTESPEAENSEPAANWSRPKGKGFFARLSNVVGNLLGRNR